MKKLLLFCIIGISFLKAAAQDNFLYQKKWMVQGNDTMPYRLLLPENYDPEKKYPLVFFLHGSGERGNDNMKQLIHGSAFFTNGNARKNYPAIVIFPQCSETGYWSNVLRLHDTSTNRIFYFLKDGPPTKDMALLCQLVQYILKTYKIKKDQVYVGGLSMGGMGVFELVRRNTGIFAAAFPIAGGADPATAKEIKNTKWWIFHGAKDDIVDPAFSERMVKALKKEKASVKFNLYQNANHNSWDAALAEPELLSWLFSQHK